MCLLFDDLLSPGYALQGATESSIQKATHLKVSTMSLSSRSLSGLRMKRMVPSRPLSPIRGLPPGTLVAAVLPLPTPELEFVLGLTSLGLTFLLDVREWDPLAVPLSPEWPNPLLFFSFGALSHSVKRGRRRSSDSRLRGMRTSRNVSTEKSGPMAVWFRWWVYSSRRSRRVSMFSCCQCLACCEWLPHWKPRGDTVAINIPITNARFILQLE